MEGMVGVGGGSKGMVKEGGGTIINVNGGSVIGASGGGTIIGGSGSIDLVLECSEAFVIDI